MLKTVLCRSVLSTCTLSIRCLLCRHPDYAWHLANVQTEEGIRSCVFFFLCASFLPKSFSQYKCKFPLYRKKSGRIEFRYNSIYSRNLIPLGLRLTEVVLIFAKASTMIKVNYWHMQTCYRRFSSCSSVLCMCAYAFSFIQFNLHFICVSIYPLALNRMHFLLLAHK